MVMSRAKNIIFQSLKIWSFPANPFVFLQGFSIAMGDPPIAGWFISWKIPPRSGWERLGYPLWRNGNNNNSPTPFYFFFLTTSHGTMANLGYKATCLKKNQLLRIYSMKNTKLVGGWATPLKKNLSVGMIIPNIWEYRTCSKPPTRKNTKVPDYPFHPVGFPGRSDGWFQQIPIIYSHGEAKNPILGSS